MKYHRDDPIRKLWLNYAVALVQQRGRIEALGELAGLLAALSESDPQLKRELYHRMDKL